MQIATIFVCKISTSSAKLSKEMHNENIRHSLAYDAGWYKIVNNNLIRNMSTLRKDT